MKFRVLAEAEQDLDDAVAFYNARRPGLGIEFAAAVAEGIERIAENPRLWHPLGPRTRRYRLKRFPYGLVYHLLGDDSLLLAVAHHSRAPAFWHSRTPDST